MTDFEIRTTDDCGVDVSSRRGFLHPVTRVYVAEDVKPWPYPDQLFL